MHGDAPDTSGRDPNQLGALRDPVVVRVEPERYLRKGGIGLCNLTVAVRVFESQGLEPML